MLAHAAACCHPRPFGSIYNASLKTQPERFIEGVEPSGLDPFRGYIVRSPTDVFTQLGDLSCPSVAANVHRHCNPGAESVP
jgi:hypothetical protein